jgi:exodeoxyribonuclease V alpha subunit
VPADACTIHKSQGSDDPAVVIPLLSQHVGILRRSLVDSAITRGWGAVVLVGPEDGAGDGGEEPLGPAAPHEAVEVAARR